MTISRLPVVLTLLGLGLAGCPGPSTTDDAATPTLDAPSALDTGTATDAAAPDGSSPIDAFSADSPSGSDAPSSDDAPMPSSDAPRLDAPGLDAPGAVRLELLEPYAYGNCFGGPPDPLLASWTLRATGAAGTHVEVTSASLRVKVDARAYDTTQDLVLDVAAFDIPAGGTIDQMQRKESGSPSVPMCTFCSDTVQGELTLEVTTDAGTQTVMANLELGCVF